MSPDPHAAVYDILVRECGMREYHEARFGRFDLETPGTFIIGGQLGLDGALVVDEEGCWEVQCHPEDRTAKVDAKINRANAALREFSDTDFTIWRIALMSSLPKPVPRFIVWTNYGTEGWQPAVADTFEAAVAVRDEQMSYGNFEVVVTEHVPLNVVDGRATFQGKEA